MKNPLSWLSKLSAKIKTKILLAIMIFLIVWLLLPIIPIDGNYPFTSIRLRILILCLAMGAYGIQFVILFLQKYKDKALSIILERLKNAFKMISSGSINAWNYSKENFNNAKDRMQKDQRRRRIRRLPWYLVLGSPQAGKKTTIKNSGLYFSKPEHIGEEAINYINQFPDFEWWFSEKAVMIDAMTYDKNTDSGSWKKFTKLLKKERKNKPLNGIILTIGLSDLLLYSNKQRQDFIQDICLYIRDIHNSFKSLVPIYIVFNKCDLIEGFMEFFDNLSKEELSQVWGMSLPVEECNDPLFVKNFFNREYGALLDQLRKRVMWALDTEATIRGRELINAFPQQMQLFKKPIEAFIDELFSAVRYHKALQFRGIYFTSCTQGEGEPIDFLLQAMSKKFQLIPPKFERSPRVGESYFMRSLFFEVILPEASLLGDSERSKKIKRLAYKSMITACPIIIISTGIGMYQGYKENCKNIQLINQKIDYYNEALINLKEGDNSLLTTLPALDQLNQARNLYVKSHAWGLHFLFATHSIKSDINDALQRALHSIFLPRIASQLEDRLNQNISNPNILYATLKGYMAFNASYYTNQYSIKAPMEYDWNRSFAAHPKTAKKLQYYLNLALNRPVEKLPLDRTLISRIRSQLEEIIPSQRAYGLLTLRASVSNVPDLIFHSTIGSDFDRVFTLSNPKLKIPALYTHDGFNRVFLKQYEPIAKEVAEDNHDIGLASDNDEIATLSQLNISLQHSYNDLYIKTWHDALDEIDVKSFDSLTDAIDVLNILISNQSPLPKLLDVIYDNTNNISHNKVQVMSNFEEINEYSKRMGNGPSWNGTINILEQLRDYLVKLQQSANQDQASFEAAKEVIQGAKNNPIQQLSLEAQKAPQPVKRWLQNLSNNCWQILVKGAHSYMNTAWQTDVMDDYNKGIRDRYPLNGQSNSNITTDDFNNFFSNDGSLDKYFNTYIKPFVNTDKTPWQQYIVDGHTIELPQSTFNLFTNTQKIRNEFFPHQAKKANFNFTIKPLTLDSRATSIQFIIGPQQLWYGHGPQNVSTITWPLPFNSETARIVITDFDSNQYAHWSSGPWSLFKMITHGVLKPTKDDGTYLFYLNFNGYTASYRITGPTDIDLFRLTNLNGYKLPNNIAPDMPINNKSSDGDDNS